MPNPAIEILELTDTKINGTISRNAFESWVDENDLREWVQTTSDEQGEPAEATGLYTWEEYYDGGGAEYDLYRYVEQRKRKKENDINLARSMRSFVTKNFTKL